MNQQSYQKAGLFARLCTDAPAYLPPDVPDLRERARECVWERASECESESESESERVCVQKAGLFARLCTDAPAYLPPDVLSRPIFFITLRPRLE